MKSKKETEYINEARRIKRGVMRGLSPLQAMMCDAITVEGLAKYLRKQDKEVKHEAE